MAGEDVSHFSLWSLGSFLPTRKRISGFCLLYITCFLCLQHVHYHLLTPTSRFDGASCSRAGIVLAAALGSDSEAEKIQTRPTRRRRSVSATSRTHQKPTGGASTVATMALRSNGGASAERPSHTGSKWTLAGWTPVESPATSLSGLSEMSPSGKEDDRRIERNDNSDRPTTSDSPGVSDSRQPFLARPDTQKEAAAEDSSGTFGSTSPPFRTRGGRPLKRRRTSSVFLVSPGRSDGSSSGEKEKGEGKLENADQGHEADQEEGRAREKESCDTLRGNSGEEDGGSREDGARGTTERNEQQKEETPNTSEASKVGRCGRSRKLKVKESAGEYRSSQEEEPNSEPEERHGDSDNALRALRPLTRRFSSLVDEGTAGVSADGTVRSPADTVQLVYATMEALREAQLTWAKSSTPTGRLKRGYRMRKLSEQSTSDMNGPTNYPLRRPPRARFSLKEWDLRRRRTQVTSPREEQEQSEEEKKFQQPDDGNEGLDVFATAERHAQHSRQDASESQGLSMTSHSRGIYIGKTGTDVGDRAGSPKKGEKRRHRKRRDVEEEGDAEDHTNRLPLSILGLSMSPRHLILTSTSKESRSADAQSEEESKQSEEDRGISLQRGMNGMPQADYATPEQPTSSEEEATATTFVLRGKGRKKKQKERLALPKSARDKAMTLAKKSRFSKDLQVSQTGPSTIEEQAASKEAQPTDPQPMDPQPMEPQPTEPQPTEPQPMKEASIQTSEAAQKQKKKKHKQTRQSKRPLDKKIKRKSKVAKQPPGTTTGEPIEEPSTSASSFGSIKDTKKIKKKLSRRDLQQKSRKSTSGEALGQFSAGIGQSTPSNSGARRHSATQKKKKEKKPLPKKKKEKKSLHQKKGHTRAHKKKSKTKLPRAATDPGSWRKSAVSEWRRKILQYPRTTQGLLNRAKAASDPARVAHAVAVLERQHNRRGPQSRILDMLQKRLAGRRRHDQRLGQLMDAMRRHFGRRGTSSSPAAQLIRREQQQQPSSPWQPEQSSDISPSLPLSKPILSLRPTYSGSGKGQAATKVADSGKLPLCASRPSSCALPRRAEEPFTSQDCEPRVVEGEAASASTVLGVVNTPLEPVTPSVQQSPPQQQEAQSDVEGGEHQQQVVQDDVGGGEQPFDEGQQMGLSPEEEADVEKALIDTMLDEDESLSPVLSNEFLRYLVSPIEDEEGDRSNSSVDSSETSTEDVADSMDTGVPSQPSAVSGDRSGVPYEAPRTSSDYTTQGSQEGSPVQTGPGFATESSVLPLQCEPHGYGEQSQPQTAGVELAAYPASSLPRASPPSPTPVSSQFLSLHPQEEMVSQGVALPGPQQVQSPDGALDLSLGWRGRAQSQLQSQPAADHQEDVSQQSSSAQAQASPQSASSVSLQPSGIPETSPRTAASSCIRPQRISHLHMHPHQMSDMESTSSSSPPSVPPSPISVPLLSLSWPPSLPRLHSTIFSPRAFHHVPHAQSAVPSPRMPKTSNDVRVLLHRMLLRRVATRNPRDQQAGQQAVHDTPTTSTESTKTRGGTSSFADAAPPALPRSTSSVQQGPATSSSVPVYQRQDSQSASLSTDPGVHSSAAQRFSAQFSSEQQTSMAVQRPSSHVSSATDISRRGHPHENSGAENSARLWGGEGFLPFQNVATPYQSFRGSQADDEDSSNEEPSSSTGHAPARRLRGQEKVEEQNYESSEKAKKVKRMQLENKIIDAGISVLRHLSADLRGSPLATVETDPEEEGTLNRVDDGLNERYMLLKSIACFRTVERHFTACRAKYVSLVDREAPNLGMRDDEVFRLLFHAAWVACYTNVKTQQLQHLVDGRLNEEEELLLLQRTPETPTRFSRNQHSLTEEVIRRFAREYPADDAKVNGTLGIIYSALIVTGLFVCLLMLHRFYQSRRCRGGENGKQQILDMTQNSHVELSHCVNHPGCTSASKNDTCVF